MKKLLITVLFILFSISINAQINSFFSLKENEGLLAGGAGLTWIDGQPFYSLHLYPEIAFSNVGIGLDLNLEFDANGNLRKENFNEFSDYLSVIRYVRYGQKHDPLYVKLGALDYATLGHGSIMYMYNNSPSFDTRKAGLVFDADFNGFGFESIYSNFGDAGVIGVRGYYRPFVMAQNTSLPILGKLEIGGTIVSDLNENAGVVAGNYNPATNQFLKTVDEGNTTIVGIDFGLPIVRSGLADLDIYFDYAKIIKFGGGASAGLLLDLKGLPLVDVQTRIERRFFGDDFIPSYFNSFYEIERFQLDKTTGQVTSKIQRLKNGIPAGNGYYGELRVTALGLIDVLGSFQKMDKDPEGGILHLYTNFAPEKFPYVVRAGYDKVYIKDLKDLFTLDDRSYLYFEFGYKPAKYIIVSMLYSWTFTPLRDANDDIVGFKPQKKIEPRISFVYPFDFGDQ